jgi:nucleotide-binding universal stress UspA family protein
LERLFSKALLFSFDWKKMAMNHKRTSELSRSTRQKKSAAQRRDQVPLVLVPLDGTAHALAALPVARALAQLTRATIHLVYIAEPTLPAHEALHKLGLGAHRVRDAVLHQASGDAAEGIIRWATEINSACIVMCMYTGQTEPTGGLGSVARAVAHSAPCPVVLVPPARGRQPFLLEHILLPYDGTPTTAAALDPALEIAQLAKAELLVLHVVTPGRCYAGEPGSVSAPRYVDQPQHDWPAWSHAFLRRAFSSRGVDQKLKLRVALAVGKPEAEVVHWARDQHIDLIVLAWRGHFEGARAAVVKAVVREAPCPLLLLRVTLPSHPNE